MSIATATEVITDAIMPAQNAADGERTTMIVTYAVAGVVRAIASPAGYSIIDGRGIRIGAYDVHDGLGGLVAEGVGLIAAQAAAHTVCADAEPAGRCVWMGDASDGSAELAVNAHGVHTCEAATAAFSHHCPTHQPTEAPALREVFVVDMAANGTRGGAFVWVNGELAGRIAVPFWGEADDPDHCLYTAVTPGPDEQLIGTAAGMSKAEARQAVIDRWRSIPAEAAEVAPAQVTPAQLDAERPADPAALARVAMDSALAALDTAILAAQEAHLPALVCNRLAEARQTTRNARRLAL